MIIWQSLSKRGQEDRNLWAIWWENSWHSSDNRANTWYLWPGTL